MQLNQLVGAHLCAFAPDKKVKMKDPDVKVHVEIIQGSAYVFSRSDRGIGGLPVGSAGKVVSLMSGGIDSPVATWKLMKRGAVIVGVHFSGAPVTDDASEYIVDDIAHALAPAGGIGRIYMVPRRPSRASARRHYASSCTGGSCFASRRASRTSSGQRRS